MNTHYRCYWLLLKSEIRQEQIKALSFFTFKWFAFLKKSEWVDITIIVIKKD